MGRVTGLALTLWGVEGGAGRDRFGRGCGCWFCLNPDHDPLSACEKDD